MNTALVEIAPINKSPKPKPCSSVFSVDVLTAFSEDGPNKIMPRTNGYVNISEKRLKAEFTSAGENPIYKMVADATIRLILSFCMTRVAKSCVEKRNISWMKVIMD